MPSCTMPLFEMIAMSLHTCIVNEFLHTVMEHYRKTIAAYHHVSEMLAGVCHIFLCPFTTHEVVNFIESERLKIPLRLY